LDLIIELVRVHGPVRRKDVDDVLLAKLPDRLSPEQKRRKVQNLMQELRRSGRIVNLGTRSHSRWVLSESPHDLAKKLGPETNKNQEEVNATP